MTVECNPDFFIYVPTVHHVENPSRVNQAGGDEIAARHSSPFHPPPDEWIQIPLEGSLVVYARLRERQQLESEPEFESESV